jgi:D-glycero-alpha-D-manno-heptose-7-phosphate kinase
LIITRTPYRISLFGGGTDIPLWYRSHGGEVLSFSIDKYCYISCRPLPPFFDFNFRLVYSRVETCNSIDEIVHPALREGIRHFSNLPRIEVQHHGDLPARSGVGSSSAFAVGLLSALATLEGVEKQKLQLARDAIFLEQNLIGENVGSQDQIACSVGGINHIEFGTFQDWSVHPFLLETKKIEEIEDRCFLLFTGITRNSSDISLGLIEGLHKKESMLNKTRSLVATARNIFDIDGNLDIIGELLLEGWHLKKEANHLAATPLLDEFIERGLSAGALGGKVLGAGGGGFCLFWLKQNDRQRFRKVFPLGIEVPFKIDFSGVTVLANDV